MDKEFIGRAIELFRAQAAEQKVELITNLSPNLPMIYGDASRLNQTLINLLSNALRHTPAGDRVTVSARSLPDQNAILIAVTDTGLGIPPSDLPCVFERFYRADKSRARSSGGSGLGLAIARQIVEAHGSQVWAESEPGQETTFSFTLPTQANPT